MSDEIEVRNALTVRKGSLQYRQPSQGVFKADMTGDGGPTPGYVLATEDGVDVDLSDLATPGVAWVQNNDDTNYIELGIYDAATNFYMPMLELLPGEGYPVRLSRWLGHDFAGTGTVDTAASPRLRVKGMGGDCRMIVDAFDQ